jgi:hypothetical protein
MCGRGCVAEIGNVCLRMLSLKPVYSNLEDSSRNPWLVSWSSLEEVDVFKHLSRFAIEKFQKKKQIV